MRRAVDLPSSSNSCALVGSSGSMLFDAHGPEIDAHDLVLRFNDAQTHGFESQVGKRTSIRILNSNAIIEVLERCAPRAACTPAAVRSCCPTERALLNSGSEELVTCYQHVCGGGLSLRSDRRLSSILHFPLVAVVSTKGGRKSVMSGLFGLAAALQLCSGPVNAYGFTTPAHGSQYLPAEAAAAASHAAYVAAAAAANLTLRRDALATARRYYTAHPDKRRRYPYHYYDRCPHSEADRFLKAANQLDRANPTFAQYASRVRFPPVRKVTPAVAVWRLPNCPKPRDEARGRKAQYRLAVQGWLRNTSSST